MNFLIVHSDISVVFRSETATWPYSAEPTDGQYCSHGRHSGWKATKDYLFNSRLTLRHKSAGTYVTGLLSKVLYYSRKWSRHCFPKIPKKRHSYEPQLASTNQHTPNFKNSTIVSNHRKSKSKSLQVSNCRLKMSDRRPGYNAVFNILFLLIGFRKSCQSRNFQFHLVEFSFRFSKTH